MSDTSEVDAFLRRHLDSVFANDVADYHATTSDELTLYEWCITAVAPRRPRADDLAGAGRRAMRLGWRPAEDRRKSVRLIPS